MSERVKGAAIGIDLGTTYSCVGFWFDKKNRVEIIPNEQENKTTPSFIAFTDTELLVGEGAKNQIARNPTNTVFGKSSQSKLFQSKLPYLLFLIFNSFSFCIQITKFLQMLSV